LVSKTIDEAIKEFEKKKKESKKKKRTDFFKKIGSGWGKAGGWVERNINPDVYDISTGFDVDPWNPFGSKRKKSKKRKKKRR